MNNNLNKKKYISEDEGAGNAAPIIEVFSSLFIILFLIWFLFESFKIGIPDNNYLTAPSLLPIIFSISILLMLLFIPNWDLNKDRVLENSEKTGSLFDVWKNRFFISVIPMGLFNYGGLMAIQTLWAGPWMIRVSGYTPLESATGLFWINVTMLISFFLWGYFLPKISSIGFSAKKILKLGLPVSFIVMFVVILLGPKAGAFYITLFILSSIFLSVTQPAVGLSFPGYSAGKALTSFNLLIFAGTFLIMIVAMCVAAPIGLLTAIYLSEYASQKVRKTVKPLLEILAGIPTIVYGFFAFVTVAPFVKSFGQSIGIDASPTSALAAGLVMGVMIIPFISSLSDDVINSVPQSLREGSLGIGANKAETIKKVILPAALPGIVGAFLLAIARAIGETMIVVVAAGTAANLTANPFENVTTVTVQIVVALIGDQEFDNPRTLSAFALGLVLFVITLSLNVLALRIVKKYRERYE